MPPSPRPALLLAAVPVALLLLAAGPATVSATWVPAAGCQAGVPCTASNTCLAAAATQVAYLPSAPKSCPAGTQQVSAAYQQVVDYNQCAWTGCSIGGCAASEQEVTASQCWWGAWNEYCCKLVTNTTLTCRQILNCIFYPNPPSPRPPSPRPPSPPPNPPPPPPPTNWAAFTNGAWDAAATSNNVRMAYVANTLARSIYSGRLLSSDPGATVFGATYQSRIVARLGGIATTMRYLDQSTEVALVESPTSYMIVFRGSEQATDWFATNLDIGWSYTTVFGPGVYVWDGFLSALLANEQALRSLVAATYAAGTTQPRKPLWFAGHSLGAAMAVLFAHYVRTNSLLHDHHLLLLPVRNRQDQSALRGRGQQLVMERMGGKNGWTTGSAQGYCTWAYRTAPSLTCLPPHGASLDTLRSQGCVRGVLDVLRAMTLLLRIHQDESVELK